MFADFTCTLHTGAARCSLGSAGTAAFHPFAGALKLVYFCLTRPREPFGAQQQAAVRTVGGHTILIVFQTPFPQ